MSELPQGWVLVPLGTLLELNPKIIAVEDCTEVGFVPMTLLGKRWFDVPGFELRQWASVKKGYTHFQDGDVLLAKITPCFENGKAGLIRGLPNGIGSGSTEYFVCRTSAGTLDSRYLLAYLKTDDFVHTGAMSMTGSVGHKRVPKEYLLGREIPLAPQREQTRIANQLDTLLARVQACNDRFDAIPALLKRFRQTVLTAASTGDLTKDWRESQPAAVGGAAREVKLRLDARRDGHAAKSKSKFKEPVQPDLNQWRLDVPESWSVESVSAFAECLDHVRVPVTKDKRATAERLYPYFGANGQVDMVDDFLFDDELVLVTEDETFYGRVKPIAYRFSGRCWVNNHAHVLLAGDRVRADYLCFSLMHYDVQPWLTGTTGRAKLTQGALNALPLAVPPQAEMVEIVRRVNSMFALTDRIEARCIAARAQAQRLNPLVLAKAFRGELVPQDPSDEPASALMARIASSNTAVARKSKQKVPVALKERAPAAINL